MKLICPVCKAEFEAQKYGTLYCSIKCRARHDYLKNTEKRIASVMAHQLANREDTLASKRGQWAALRADPVRYAEYLKRRTGPDAVWRRLKQKYDMSREQYEEMHESQRGLCAICGKPQGKAGTISRLVVDHNHQTGKLRQLLCNACNRGLGLFLDTPNLLEAAARYLRSHE